MKLKPLNNELVVKCVDGMCSEPGVRSLIVGKILAIGNECDTTLKIADLVVFSLYYGISVTIDDVRFKVLKDVDIIAIVED